MIMMIVVVTDSTLAAGLDRSSTTVRAGRGGERKQTGTPRGGKLGRQATGLCGASHDTVSHRIALHSMTLHYMTLPYVASLRRISEGYSLAFLGDSARPRVLVPIRADLTFAVNCLVPCTQKKRYLLPIRERCKTFCEHVSFQPNRRKERCTKGKMRDVRMGAPE